MLIQCPQCETTFRLDEKLLPAEGSRVRCSRCRHVFRVEPPTVELPATERAAYWQEANTEGISSPGLESEALSPAEEEDLAAALKKSPRKKVWGLLGLFVLLVLLVITIRYSYLQLMSPHQEFLEIFKEVFFIPADREGSKKIRLTEVRGFFKNHPTDGRYFVVEGKVVNGYGDSRNRIRLRGTLQDPSRRVVAQREVTAGWALKEEELDSQSLADTNRLQESHSGPLVPGAALAPGASAPFMMIFSPIPTQLAEFAVEVLESRKNTPGTAAAR
jgi:predicted Zn finger-like uncharacterized protein